MSWKSFFIQQYAHTVKRKIQASSRIARENQHQLLRSLVNQAKNTSFGKDHHFNSIIDHQSFTKYVPLRDYEGLKPYINTIIEGKTDVLWTGKPKYFAKTSGTTSGTKYIPITAASMPNHMNGARNALLNYTSSYNKSNIFDHQLMFLSGSPTLTDKSGIPTGRLSGIVNHEIPWWLKKNQIPTWETNCIEDWEEKVDKVVKETFNKRLAVIGGIPPWVQMYFEKMLDFTGKNTITEVFPDLQCFVYGGVNYKPYKDKINSLIGKPIDSIELFPASEGFFAFQDIQGNNGMLLETNAGIFYEFIPLDQIHEKDPTRLTIDQVELDKDYALIITSNAGLWAYNIGDTVRFTSIDPYRVIVSGRIKHYISAFGEHVIATEVENAFSSANDDLRLQANEFTVAPQVNPPEGGLPYHEWFIAFDESPNDIKLLEEKIDQALQEQNIYYKDLIEGAILRPLKVTPLRHDAFRLYMQKIGKLGGQNKVPRLSNDRNIADQLQNFRF